MPRPMYITQEQLDVQNAITDRVAEHIHYRVRDMDPYSPASHILSKNGEERYVVKAMRREVSPSAHFLRDEGFHYSKEKADTLKRMADKRGAEAVMLIQFSDQHIYYLNLSQAKPNKRGRGGRDDRNDPKDVESMYYYSMRKLKRVL